MLFPEESSYAARRAFLPAAVDKRRYRSAKNELKELKAMGIDGPDLDVGAGVDVNTGATQRAVIVAEAASTLAGSLRGTPGEVRLKSLYCFDPNAGGKCGRFGNHSAHRALTPRLHVDNPVQFRPTICQSSNLPI